MITQKKTDEIDMKVLLSSLWIFVLLNIIFRDIHEFIKAEFIQEIMTGIIGGVKITEELLFIGGILVEIPILMVLLSRVLPDRLNRWLNIGASIITLVVIVTSSRNDLDDNFFAIIEIAALLLIIWFAWRWSKHESQNG